MGRWLSVVPSDKMTLNSCPSVHIYFVFLVLLLPDFVVLISVSCHMLGWVMQCLIMKPECCCLVITIAGAG